MIKLAFFVTLLVAIAAYRIVCMFCQMLKKVLTFLPDLPDWAKSIVFLLIWIPIFLFSLVFIGISWDWIVRG